MAIKCEKFQQVCGKPGEKPRVEKARERGQVSSKVPLSCPAGYTPCVLSESFFWAWRDHYEDLKSSEKQRETSLGETRALKQLDLGSKFTNSKTQGLSYFSLVAGTKHTAPKVTEGSIYLAHGLWRFRPLTSWLQSRMARHRATLQGARGQQGNTSKKGGVSRRRASGGVHHSPRLCALLLHRPRMFTK